jgi:hypothetical protein
MGRRTGEIGCDRRLREEEATVGVLAGRLDFEAVWAHLQELTLARTMKY